MLIEHPITSLSGAIGIPGTVVGTCMDIRVPKDLHSDLRMAETQLHLDYIGYELLL